jgi:hypothetical protein
MVREKHFTARSIGSDLLADSDEGLAWSNFRPLVGGFELGLSSG